MPPEVSVAACTDTYGTEMQNGVARFWSGLHAWSRENGKQLHVYSSGDHLERYPDVQNLHGLSYSTPAFGKTELYYPLEGKRRQMRRDIKRIDPDVLHIPTPGAIGLTALGVAHRQKRLVAGIYHTDFPAFAEQMTRRALEALLDSKGGGFVAAGAALAPLWKQAEQYTEWWERWILGFLLKRILHRNREKIDATLRRAVDGIAWLAKEAVVEMMREFHGRFHLTIARSETYRSILIEQLSLPADRVATLQSGVDTSLFSPEKTDADDNLRERLGIPADANVVLYVGRITDEKNVGFLADAWRAYQEKANGNKAVLVMVGSGKTDEYAERAGKNTIMLGPRSGAELSALYRTAKVFWTASDVETLGQVVSEAAASGLPVIVSKQGAASEHVRNGQTGLVLPTEDPSQWAGTLDRLLQDDGRCRRMGESARLAMEPRTIDASYRHFWQLHEELVQREQQNGVQHSLGGLPIRVTDPLPPVQPEATPLILLGDYHPGLGQKPERKEGALRAIGQRAAAQRAEICLLGDFTDTRADPAKMHQELGMFRRIMQETGARVRMIVEGNHDWESARAQRLAELVGCEVEESLVAMGPDGTVLTHGHVGELPELEQIIESGKASDDIIAALSVEKLRPALKRAAFEYDVIGLIEHGLEDIGLKGLDDMWRNIGTARHRLAEWVQKLVALPGLELRSPAVQTAIHRLAVASREKMLLKLCGALGGNKIVYGHTHEPYVRLATVIDPVSRQPREVIIANTGSFRRKKMPITWVEVHGRTVCLYGYDHKNNAAVLIESISLSYGHQSSASVRDVTLPAAVAPTIRTNDEPTASPNTASQEHSAILPFGKETIAPGVDGAETPAQ